MTGNRIPYGRYGYSHLLAFLSSLTDVITIQGHGRHALLFPIISKETESIAYMIQKQRKPPKPKQRFQYDQLEPDNLGEVDGLMNLSIKESQCSDLYSITSVHSNASNIYQDIGSDDVGYPQDAVQFASDIKVHSSITEVMKPHQGIYRVRISNIFDPYKFWFQLDNRDLDLMIDELQSYYEQLPEDVLVLNKPYIREKAACAVRFKGRWYRGEFVSNEPHSNGDFKVFLLDYGKVVCISPNCIKFLMKQFLKLPRQAYRGRLAFVKPKQTTYSPETTQKLKEFVTGVILFAKVELHTPEQNCHYLTLIHTYTADDIKVDKYLVSQCSDVLPSEAKGKISHTLLFPTFVMLEKDIFDNGH